MQTEAPFTVVLIHGSYHGGWCWDAVTQKLTEKGHSVHAPSCVGAGERWPGLAESPEVDTWVSDIVEYLEARQLSNVVLVGHSFGGRVIAGVADRIPARLAHLVFVDSSIPDSGSSFAKEFEPDAWEIRRSSAIVANGIRVMPPPTPQYFGVFDPEQIEHIRARLTPMPLSLFESTLTLENPVGNGLNATFVHCIEPKFLHIEKHANRSKELGWNYFAIKTGHDVMFTAPVQLSNIIDTAASLQAQF